MAITVACPECDADVEVTSHTGEIELGDETECDECGVPLVVTALDPLELDVDETAADGVFDDCDEDDDEY